MLADYARTLDPFGKAAEELIEASPSRSSTRMFLQSPPSGSQSGPRDTHRTRYYAQG